MYTVDLPYCWTVGIKLVSNIFIFTWKGDIIDEAIKLLRRIENKLEEMDERLKRIERELFDELSEQELRELEEDLKAYKEGKLELVDLEEVERRLV